MAYVDVADKATLDIVKNNTDIIKSQSNNYIDSNFLGLNFKLLKTSEYLIVSDLITYVGATKTILDIKGKGYIEYLYAYNNNAYHNEKSNFTITLTIDGNAYKFVAYSEKDYTISSRTHLGLGREDTANPYKNIDSTNIYDILSTNNIIHDNGFKFNKSFKVEIKREGDVYSDIQMYYSGGVIIG